MSGIAARGVCECKILPGNGNGVERRSLASLSVGRQMDLCHSTFSPPPVPYHQPFTVTDLESILISEHVENKCH